MIVYLLCTWYRYMYSTSENVQKSYSLASAINTVYRVFSPFYTCKSFHPVFNLPRHSRVMRLFLINPVIKRLFWIHTVLNLTADIEGKSGENKTGAIISLYMVTFLLQASFMHLLLIFFNANTFLWINKLGKCKMQLFTAQNCCIALCKYQAKYFLR